MDTPTLCRARRENASRRGGRGDTSQQREIRSSGPLEISAERFNSSVAQLTSNSIDELHQLASELQKMQEFLKSRSKACERQINSAVAGINIIVETIGPWKNMAGSAKHLHQATATSVQEDWRPPLSSAFAPG